MISQKKPESKEGVQEPKADQPVVAENSNEKPQPKQEV
jgi:hypothetical protein